MPIINEEKWNTWVNNNTDPYGKACVDVARRVMELLDEYPENDAGYDCHRLICQADKDVGAGGITGFMAGCAAQIVSECHSRGPQFRAKWNYQLAGEDGDFVTQAGSTINPAMITIGMIGERDGN